MMPCVLGSLNRVSSRRQAWLRGMRVVFALAACLPAALLLAISASAACEGDSCPEEHQAAQAAGLLGATACTPRQYPRQGPTPTPVRPARAGQPAARPVWAG